MTAAWGKRAKLKSSAIRNTSELELPNLLFRLLKVFDILRRALCSVKVSDHLHSPCLGGWDFIFGNKSPYGFSAAHIGKHVYVRPVLMTWHGRRRVLSTSMEHFPNSCSHDIQLGDNSISTLTLIARARKVV